jgi:triosephosphate isomerase (TIM)
VRHLMIAGNWKMHGLQRQVQALTTAIKEGVTSYTEIEVVLFPAFVHLNQVQALLTQTAVKVGAQNLYPAPQGAFTGEVSGPMLVDIGCQYVLVGHSERRMLFQEDLALVAAKCQAAVAVGLQPILCVGETKAQRERGETEAIIAEQIRTIIECVGVAALQQAVIAYEPVWAIGTGLTATPEQAQAVHAFIRHLVAQNNLDIAKAIRILYGGSMKADHAAPLLAMPDIDGGLVGGASLDADHFLAICARAHQQQSEYS